MAVLQTAAFAAVLPSTRRWRCQGSSGRVSGDHSQQGPGAPQIQEGAAFQRQECHPV